MQSTRDLLLTTEFPDLVRESQTTLQVNLGYTCNLSCTHCHVNAGPSRTEQMDRKTVDLIIEVLAQGNIGVLDITGGAPEMNPHFRYLVTKARALNIEVIDRCNLTILEEPGYEWLLPFLVEQQVAVVASLPCYSEDNVTLQRGKGVFDKSIRVLQALNTAGYGHGNLVLNLVYNPGGSFLPPDQLSLEQKYRDELGEHYGIIFDNLFTLTNMPISRFGAVLLATGEFERYMTLLRENFAEENLASLMCKSTISVDWQGMLYDCDFNQMLALPMRVKNHDDLIAVSRPGHLGDLLTDDYTGHSIVTGDHCYGCTAGQGSSCGGALN